MGFPGRLVGAPLKLEHVPYDGDDDPGFPGRLVGAPLKQDPHEEPAALIRGVSPAVWSGHH